MDDTQETDDLIQRMTESLQWSDHILEIDWSTGRFPRSDSLKYAIGARRYVAEAASDLNRHDLVRELCAGLDNTGSPWCQYSPDVQYAHASLVCFYADYRARDKERDPQSESASGDHSNDLLEVAIPYVDHLYQAEKRRQSTADARWVRLRSRAYGRAIVNLRNQREGNIHDLMNIMRDQVDESPDVSSARVALALAIDSLIGRTTESVDPLEIKKTVTTYFCQPNECRDGSGWLVVAVGIIGKLGAHLYPEDDDFFFDQLCSLLNKWNADCYRDDNAGYASFQALEFLEQYLLNNQQLLSDERLYRMLGCLLAVPERFGLSVFAASPGLFRTVLDQAPPGFRTELLERYTAPLRPSETIQDPLSYGNGLARLTHYHLDNASVQRSWDFVIQAPREVQTAWFEQISGLTDKELSPELVRVHIDRLVAFSQQPETGDECYRRWSEALVATVSSAIAFNERAFAVRAVDRFEGSGHTGDGLWPALIAIAATGEGRRDPETVLCWCRGLLNAASTVVFSDDNCGPWLMATCTLTFELSAAQATDTKDLIALHERIVDAVRKTEGAGV